jgi:hypothetical protein
VHATGVQGPLNTILATKSIPGHRRAKITIRSFTKILATIAKNEIAKYQKCETVTLLEILR